MIYFAGAIALMVVLLLIAASECYRLGHLNETNRRDIQILRKELWNKKDELTSAKIDGGLLRDELHSKVSEVSSLKDEIERQIALPLTADQVQKIYNWDGPTCVSDGVLILRLFKAVEELCISHERLRLEVEGARKILADLEAEATKDRIPTSLE